MHRNTLRASCSLGHDSIVSGPFGGSLESYCEKCGWDEEESKHRRKLSTFLSERNTIFILGRCFCCNDFVGGRSQQGARRFRRRREPRSVWHAAT